MPDLLVHMTFAILLGVIFKIKNWKFLITGALLPDISRIILTIINFLKFDEVKSLLFIEPIHTPFISILLGLSIALLFENHINNFLVISLGVITHFFLDLLQFVGKFGTMWFYPFYFKEYTLNLFYGGLIILPISAIIVLIFCFPKLKKYDLKFKKNFYFLIPIIPVIIIMLSTQNILLQHNFKGTDFVLDPEKYENKDISLLISSVVSENPVKLNEMNHVFELELKEKPKLNSIVTVYGIYKDKKIYVDQIFYHNHNKEIFSVFGLFVFLYLIFKK